MINKIKSDTTNSGLIKLCLLAHGVKVSNDVIKEYEGRFLEKKYRFGKSDNKGAPLVLPYEIELPNNVIVGVHYNINSPWQVMLDSSKNIGMYLYDSYICEVRFVDKPSFWGHRLSCGKLTDDVAVLYTKYALTFFSNSYCHYWEKHLACKFCSLKPTRNTVAKVVDVVTPNMAKECVELALKLMDHNIDCIKFTSGTYKDRNRGILEAIDIWHSIMPVSKKNILHHLVAMPPKDLSLLRDLKKTGIDTISMALEVTDRSIFQHLCPGKAKDIGYDGYIKAFNEAVKIFGHGKVYCALVGGLEPLESMYHNLHEFAQRGIVPSVNIFHPDIGSLMVNHPRPTEIYLHEMVLRETALFDQYRFEPCVRGNTRNSLDNECVRGFFK